MNLLYLIAAALFVIAAVLSVLNGGGMDLWSGGYLVTAGVLLVLGLKPRIESK